MTDRATLEALLARVLEGTGPDRELDARIYILIEGGSTDDADYAATDPDVTCNPPHYTSSLDAALTLVPEGWAWQSAMRPWFTPVVATGNVWRVGQQSATFAADAATPARALIAACLKARMQAQGERPFC